MRHHTPTNDARHQIGRDRLARAMRECDAAEGTALAGWTRRLGWSGLGAACTALVLLSTIVVMRGGSTRPEVGQALPIATLTPGAVSPLTAAELCAGARPSRVVDEGVRQRVLREYGMEQVSQEVYELDALITPELGGTTERANLWPQRYAAPVWNAYVKDALEQHLVQMVCSEQIDLAQAQREIATDWVAAYKRHFATDAPLHVGQRPLLDDDALVLASASFASRPYEP